MSNNWEMVIGLEVHAQLKTSSKLFSSSPNLFGSEPNENVNFIDSGMPGMLPVLNWACIEKAIKTGFALNFTINKHSVFERKNYFYPDLPQGYQISQFEFPILSEGYLEIDQPDGSAKKIRIERAHLEQDAGKSIHDIDPKFSFIDLNRVGTPLLEIVSYPDLSSADDVVNYISSLRQTLMYIDVCDGNMQEGSLRADVNLSVRKPGGELGTRCEIKNLNSFKFIRQAIEFEFQRQIDVLEAGGSVEQNTMLFDTSTGETRSMRSKEFSHDYRYFPDPDLPPLVLNEEDIEKLRLKLPELPDQKKSRFIEEFGITAYDAEILVTEKYVSDFFEQIVKGRDSKIVISWITVELFSYLKRKNISLEESKIGPEKISSLLDLIISNKISNRQAKEIFDEYLKSDVNADTFIEKKGLVQISNESEIEELVEKVLKENPKMLEQYKSGKDKLFGFFIGQVMKLSNGKANPKMVNETLKRKLSL